MLNWQRAAFWALAPVCAAGLVWAQSSPNWKQGYIPSAQEWNELFASKQDLLGNNGTVDIEHGGTAATTAADARTNLGVPGLGDKNVFALGQIFASGVNCFIVDCAATVGTGGAFQFDGVDTFDFTYHVGGVQHKANIDADAATLQTPLAIASGGTGADTALGALNAFGSYPLFVSTQANRISTTPTVVTGTTLGLTGSKTYYFRAQMFVTADTTGGTKIRMGSPDTLTATSIRYRLTITCAADGAVLATAVESDITTNLSYAGICASQVVSLEGVIQVNVAGTMGVMFSQSAANGTSSILVNSSIQYQQEN